MSTSLNYSFVVVSKRYGVMSVIAPERFRAEIEKHTWHVSYRGPRHRYVRTRLSRRGPVLYLHRLIWSLAGNPGDAEDIDHVDRNTLNNSEDNLRAATHAQNMWNVGIVSTNKSGAIGVTWHKAARKWEAKFRENGKRRYLGLFDSFVNAVAARDAAVIAARGEYASLNSSPACAS